jgi:hypothetical protein
VTDIWSSERGRQTRHKLLRLTASGDDPEMAELTQEILAGNITFGDSLTLSGYSEIVLSRLQPIVRIWQSMSEGERQHARPCRGASRRGDLGHRGPAGRPTPAYRSPDETEESFEDRTYLRRPSM